MMAGAVARSGLIVAALLATLGIAAYTDGWLAETGDSALALEVVSGDADCNGEVDVADVTSGLLATAGLGGGCFETAGDVDCDGATDQADVLRLLRHVGGVPMSQPGGCPPIGQARELPPTSHELIEEALASGEITKGESLLYHLFADFGDNELPDEYTGPNTGHLESSIFQEIVTVWDSLSGAEQAALEPYLLPPTDGNSWVEQGDVGAAAIEWETVSSDRVKVWWQTRRPEDAAKASAVLAAMEDKIWPDLVTYMGEDHAPLSDAGYPGSGGDGKFDIYLVHIPPDPPEKPTDPPPPPVLGYVSPLTDAQGNRKCEETPTFMNLNSRTPLSPEFLATVAHEFMHALQFTYDVGDCVDYRWMFEATAEWAEHFVYPRVNSEHSSGSVFLNELDVPFERWVYKDHRQYGAYLFWFFLANQYGMHDAVADTWLNSFEADSLDAIETVIAGRGGFKKVWPEFALFNWNRPPYEEYTEWDKLWGSAEWKDQEIQVNSGQPTSYMVPTDLAHMTQDHYHFEVNENVKILTFINPFPGTGEDEAKVQALIYRNGQWSRPALDWTDEERVSLCLEKPEEDVDELVLIITNSDHQDRQHTFDVGPLELVASPVGCQGWSGTVSAEVNYFDATFTVTVNDVLFQHLEGDLDNERYIGYTLVSAGITWHVEGTWPGGCEASGSMTLDPPLSGGSNEAMGYLIVDNETNTYSTAITGHRDQQMFTLTCPDDSFEMVWPVIYTLWDGGNIPHEVEEGPPPRASGEFTDPAPAYGGTWRWDLTYVE